MNHHASQSIATILAARTALVTRVVNLRKEPYDIYIGRGSPFGNPFTHKKDGTKASIVVDSREEAIDLYAMWLVGDVEIPGAEPPTKDEIMSLKGKTLGCFCKPKSCHGDVLVALVEG